MIVDFEDLTATSFQFVWTLLWAMMVHAVGKRKGKQIVERIQNAHWWPFDWPEIVLPLLGISFVLAAVIGGKLYATAISLSITPWSIIVPSVVILIAYGCTNIRGASRWMGTLYFVSLYLVILIFSDD